MRGSRTVLESWIKIDENGTVVRAPIITSRRIGVTMMPCVRRKVLGSGDLVCILGWNSLESFQRQNWRWLQPRHQKEKLNHSIGIEWILTSFPSTALVSMTADETGGGIHPTTCRLKHTAQPKDYDVGCYYNVWTHPLKYSGAIIPVIPRAFTITVIVIGIRTSV